MSDMSTLSSRIKWLKNTKQLKDSDLARAGGVKQPSVNDWASGKTKKLKSEVALRLAKELKLNMDWLVTGRGQPELESDELSNSNTSQYVKVFLSKVTFQAGYGCEPTIEEEQSGELINLKKDFFDNHHIDARKCICFRVEGDSMIPLIYEGEYVIVDTSQNDLRNIKDGKIYAICVEGAARIKRLYRKLDGSLIIRSENKDFSDDQIEGEKLNMIKLIGRVVARLGTRPFE